MMHITPLTKHPNIWVFSEWGNNIFNHITISHKKYTLWAF